MGLYSGGLIMGRTFPSEIWGAYFLGGEGWGFIIGILRYLYLQRLIFARACWTKRITWYKIGLRVSDDIPRPI